MGNTRSSEGEDSTAHEKEISWASAKMPWGFNMSTVSFVAALIGVGSFYAFLWFYLRMNPLWRCLVPVPILSFTACIVMGIGWLVYSAIRREKLSKGHVLVFVGFIILVWVVLASAALPIQMSRIRSLNIRSRLDRIYAALQIYCDENEGRLPSAEHWADLLLKQDKRLSVDDFRYPKGKYGVFVFAFNRNLDGLRIAGIPANTVLVIECEGAWNLAGGQELLGSKLRKRDGFFVLKSSGAVHYTQILPDGTFTPQFQWEP